VCDDNGLAAFDLIRGHGRNGGGRPFAQALQRLRSDDKKLMQLDLGLKRASPDDGARNPPGPLKTYSVQ